MGWVGAFIGTLGLGALVDAGISMSHAIAYTAIIYAVVAICQIVVGPSESGRQTVPGTAATFTPCVRKSVP